MESPSNSEAVAIAVGFHAGASADGPALGTISVAGPIVRVTRPRYPEIAAALKEAGEDLAAIWPLRRRQARPLGVESAGPGRSE